MDNGESYTLAELRCIRWELNNWRRLANVLQRELKQSGMEGSIQFDLDELIRIRSVIALLDSKLPGHRLVFQEAG